MVVYSIKDIEHLSGVKAHTIRIWEKRYNIIEPKRTATNIRYYEEDDLKQILNIAILNNNGYKISQIAKMEQEEIIKKVAQISDFDDRLDDRIDALTMSMMELNEFKFDRILDTHIDQIGLEKAMDEVVFPLLDKLGELWMSGCIKPVHETFVSQIIKRKIVKAIDELPINTDQNIPSFLIFLPRNESSELSLLFLHFMLKKDGFRVTNLGMNIDNNMIIQACQIMKPDYTVIIANESFSEQPLEPYLINLIKNIGDCSILLTGYQALKQNIKSTRKVKVLTSLEKILEFCNGLKIKS